MKLLTQINISTGMTPYQVISHQVITGELKNREFTSLNLRITDQNNNVITDGLQVTVVLHVCDHKI